MKLTTLCACAALLAAAGVARAATGFTDTTMNPSDYSAATFNTDPSVTIAVSQSGAGNPGASLAIDYRNTGGAVSMVSMIGLIYDGFSYDPATQGAFAGLDFSNDRYVDFGAALNPSLTTFSRPLLYQGGHYYYATVSDAQTRQAWFTTAATGLTAGLFSGFDFATGATDSSHPDFSAAGGAIEFGVLTRFVLDTAGAPVALAGRYGYDNLSMTVNTAPVPEPQTWALMAGGLLMLVWSRRRFAPR